MTVYDALEKRHDMPRAWDDWADYRAAWSNWVIRHSKWDSSILIVGAGACNDYDLTHFAKFYGEIVLFDINGASMQAALARVPQRYRGRIRCMTGDLMGILPQEYEEFCYVLQELVNRRGKLTDIRELSALAIPQAINIYARAAKRREKLRLPQADYVVVSGVHSQINHMLPWIWQAYVEVLGQRDDELFQLASQENTRIAQQVNEKLCAAAKKGVFVSAEASRAGVPGAVEGAWQALEELHARTDEHRLHVTDETHFAWGYDLRQHMIYEMEALALSKS